MFAAVACRIGTNAPLGCQFSGGLDSSAIACIARKTLPTEQELYTYSATYRNIDSPFRKEVNEQGFQDSIVQEGGFNQRSFDASVLSPLVDTDRYLEIMGEPVYYPNMHSWAMQRRLSGILMW